MLSKCKGRMKMLYVGLRHDPHDCDAASGVDYMFYSVLKKSGIDIKVIGPFSHRSLLLERVFKKIYPKLTGKKYAKFSFFQIWLAAKTIERAEKEYKPDVIFTIFPAVFTFYKGSTPCVCELDTTFLGQEEQWPLYGKLALKMSVWQEKRAFAKCAKVTTRSQWSKDVLMKKYGLGEGKIELLNTPPGFTEHTYQTPADINSIEPPVKLLLVGKVYKRKGIDIGIDVVKQLNRQGVPTKLTVCGLKQQNIPEKNETDIKFVGPFKKSDPAQVERYMALYKQAHFLIHPARFEAAGIVPSEAAAFGVPTITNDSGGLASTVKDGESGVVLPRGSPAEDYAKVIIDFVRQPQKYAQLRKTTYQRYKRELSCDVWCKKIISILREAAKKKQRTQKDAEYANA